MPVLARTRTQGALAGAHRGHGVVCQLDGAPNGNGAGRARRSRADETAGQQDSGSNPAPQDFWVSLQLEYQQLE